MTKLSSGDNAPAFSEKNQNGKTLTLNNLKGKKLVIYFYPKDDTPGCTTQSCNLRDNYDLLLKKGYEVIGVSNDDEKSHQKFIKKFNLPFDLLADVDKKMVNDYGVYGEKTNFGHTYMGIIRTTFIINENGIIEEVISPVVTDEHTQQILK